MPWFERNPIQDDLDFWQGHPGSNRHKVAKWPHPNTLRIQPRYRVKDTDPTLIPLAMRYGFWYSKALLPYDRDVPEFNAAGWWDLLVRGDNHIGVTTEESAAGYVCDINVKHLEELPVRGVPGIEFSVVFQHATLGDLTYFEEYPVGQLTNLWKYDMNTWVFSDLANRYWTQPDPPYANVIIGRLFGVSDCYGFPQTPVGMAAFNGSDAFISLLQDITGFNQDFVIDVDVRLNDAMTWWPVFGRAGLGGFIGMDGADLIFGSVRETTTWTPVEDVWFNWRLEFEQPDLLKLKLFIDDVLVATTITSRFNTPINRVGVYKQGASGSLWMNGDMKNLKVLLGDYPSTDVELDMPLIENAQDAGPEANHGTTFNMELPSV